MPSIIKPIEGSPQVIYVVGPLAGIPLLSGTVMAAEEKKANLVKVNELPIYGAPCNKKMSHLEEEDKSALLSGISEVRKSVWLFMDSTKETTNKIQDKYAVAKAHTLDLYEVLLSDPHYLTRAGLITVAGFGGMIAGHRDAIHYIQNDPGYLPRIGVITVSGLGGIVAGYKGGVFRKSIFALTAMGAAAALCYPDQALDISKTSYESAQKHALELWKEAKVKTDAKPTAESKPEKAKSDKSPAAGDMGMSKPEDKDLYSTRS